MFLHIIIERNMFSFTVSKYLKQITTENHSTVLWQKPAGLDNLNVHNTEKCTNFTRGVTNLDQQAQLDLAVISLHHALSPCFVLFWINVVCALARETARCIAIEMTQTKALWANYLLIIKVPTVLSNITHHPEWPWL